jgi:hypothetical protein
MNGDANKIKSGIKTKDPYEIAKSLTLPPLRSIAGNASNSQPRIYNEKLSIDGLDWSNVLNAFLQARDCAFAVSLFAMVNYHAYHNIHSFVLVQCIMYAQSLW